MSTQKDDLEAVRNIAVILEPFDQAERERILRWARERVGMVVAAFVPEVPRAGGAAPPPTGQDIRSFIQSKQPENDTQLAATVAYYYRFVAPESDRKDAITGPDLVEACRQSNMRRPARASQTLINAKEDGFLDRTAGGGYKINSVGENLVSVVLPGGSTDTTRRKPRKKASSKKRAAKQGKRRR